MKSDKKKRKIGKVIRQFSVEIADANSDSAFKSNQSNPYIHLSEEERLKDFIEIFSILWAESCRESSVKKQ